ncbi:MAG: ATP-binding protein [Bacteroidales bacterium]|nr:ATP-binding protein [Bacteroidales bacterium]
MAINKNILRQCIVDKREEVENVDVIERQFEFEDNGNYVFVGVRHVGKSFMMYQRIKQLLKRGYKWDRILLVSFEDERLAEFSTEDLNTILEVHYEKYGTDNKPFIFLDEIQNVNHWDKFVRRLVDGGYKVCVTGSNAKMLSQDVATTLGGRFFIVDVYPFTFQEFLVANKLKLTDDWQFSTIEKSKVQKLFNEYFKFGGLPEVVNYKAKRSFVLSLYQKIYLSDICLRNQIRNFKALDILIKKLAECVKQPLSAYRLLNILKSTNNKVAISTLTDYIQNVIDSWLVVPVSNGISNLTERETNRKYYFIDNGLLNLFLYDSDSSLLENLVAITLFRKYGCQNVYYAKFDSEIDFILFDEKIAIQVSYSIQDEQTKKREIKALLDFKNHHKDFDLQIITFDEKLSIKENDIEIKVIPIIEWLLEN